jgi:hypothetical protein
MRDDQGRYRERPDSLGKTYGLRVRKDLDPALASLAAAAQMTPTEWCRQVVEAEIEGARRG